MLRTNQKPNQRQKKVKKDKKTRLRRYKRLNNLLRSLFNTKDKRVKVNKG